MDYEKLGVGLVFVCVIALEVAVLMSPGGIGFIQGIRCKVGLDDCRSPYSTEPYCLIRYSSPGPCILTADSVIEHNREIALAEAAAPKVIYVNDREIVEGILDGMGDSAAIAIYQEGE